MAFWILGTVANALAPTLLKPSIRMWLVALEPRNRYLLLTANRTDVVPFVVFATFRRIASDPVYFALGHLYGDRSIRWVEAQAGKRGGRLVRFVERTYRRASRLMVFLFPGLVVCTLAGATGMRPRTFLAWNLAGTVTAVVVLRAFARQLEGPLTAVTEWIDRNATPLTVLTVALVVGYLLVQRVRGESEFAAVRELTDDEPLADTD